MAKKELEWGFLGLNPRKGPFLALEELKREVRFLPIEEWPQSEKERIVNAMKSVFAPKHQKQKAE